MAKKILRRFSFRKAVRPMTGFAMMLDEKVAPLPKILAVLCGGAVTLTLMMLETPLALGLAAIPGVGLVFDFVLDGVQAVYLPAVIACSVLPYILDKRSRWLFNAEKTLPYVED